MFRFAIYEDLRRVVFVKSLRPNSLGYVLLQELTEFFQQLAVRIE